MPGEAGLIGMRRSPRRIGRPRRAAMILTRDAAEPQDDGRLPGDIDHRSTPGRQPSRPPIQDHRHPVAQVGRHVRRGGRADVSRSGWRSARLSRHRQPSDRAARCAVAVGWAGFTRTATVARPAVAEVGDPDNPAAARSTSVDGPGHGAAASGAACPSAMTGQGRAAASRRPARARSAD